ncbi:MAG TPA: TonB-dependent receptor plug domain-containing protein [Opitutaceae bacterium]|nr:TonB-dependent receptor plug domain-containing protein [Opitutaceae bacterium]
MKRLSRSFVFAFTTFASTLAAQTPPAANDPAVELSPFVVSSEQDTGYAAQSTLSGTRTRTPLKDVPSAIGVFTADFLDDLGAISEREVLAYSASVVPELGDQNASVNGNAIAQPTFNFRIRGQAASRARNYFTALAPPDTYNLERLEESRGPNAILFGTGGAGGILNQSTKRANLTRTQTSLTATTGNDSLLRGEIDHNQVLAANKLALRFNGVVHDGDDTRPHQFSHEQRGTLAATYQIAPKVRLYAEAETGKIHDALSREFGARDFYSLWLERGRPTTATRTANAANGIALTANQQRVTIVGNDNTVHNFQQMAQSTPVAARRGEAVLDESVVPLMANVQGPGSERFITYHSATAFLELQPARDLFIELAADYQAMAYRRFDPLAGAYEIYGEAGSVYREGTPNPYAGQFYIDSQWRKVKQSEDLRSLRATVSYSLNLGRWGRHNLAAMGQQVRDRYRSDSMFNVLLGRPFNASPFNIRNQTFTRTYFSLNTGADAIAVPNWRVIPRQLSVVTDPGVAASTFNTGWITNASGINDDWTIQRSYLASVQSYFFNDKLVTSLGVRRDERDLHNRPLLSDPATGVTVVDYRTAAVTKVGATQGSLGVVYHVRPWLSLLYNRSENAGEPGTRTELIPDGSLQPISHGQGEDVGLTVSLLDRRVTLRLARFETTMIDDSKSVVANANTIDRHNRILDTMITDRILTTAEATALRYRGGSNVDLLDRKTTGWELGVTANPTAHWRMIFNASQGKSVETNLLKRTRVLMPDLLAVWQRARPASVTNGTTTVAQEIADFQTWFATTTAVEGKSSLGDREWQAKFFNRYEFSEGLLKGVFVGGGFRYQSQPTIGANPTSGLLYQGESLTEVDALLGYTTRAAWFGRNTRVTIQLNVYDLLQRRDYYSLRREVDGLLTTIRVPDPTTWRLQAKFAF